MHMADSSCSLSYLQTPLCCPRVLLLAVPHVQPLSNGAELLNACVDDGAGSIAASEVLMLL